MKIVECVQGTQEWLDARLGIPSASNFYKVITSAGNSSAQTDGYINSLVAERITRQPTFVQVTDHMKRGTELEPFARDEYQRIFNVDVQQVGFCLHDTLEAGASPDGLVGDGGLEIKCPAAGTHIEYLRGGELPSKYFQQVQGCMWITGREWWDFMSFHPDMHPFVIRVRRDEKFIAKLESKIKDVCSMIVSLTQEIGR